MTHHSLHLSPCSLVEHPTLVENEGPVFIPHSLFDFSLERMRTRSPYQVIELGLPYHMLRDVLEQIEDAIETPLLGFGDLPAETIMQVIGFPLADAILAYQWENDEPYLLQGPQRSSKKSAYGSSLEAFDGQKRDGYFIRWGETRTAKLVPYSCVTTSANSA